MKLEVIRKSSYNGKAIQSEKLELTKELIQTWLLNRIEVPEFSDTEHAKKFITALNLLSEPIAGGVPGPVGYFYDDDLISKGSLGNIDIKTIDGETINVEVNKFNMWEENQPGGNIKLRKILQEEKSEQINLKSYSSYSAEKKIAEDNYSFSGVYVDYLIAFISIYHIEKLGKNSIDWFDSSTNEKLDIIDDIDDYWCFVG